MVALFSCTRSGSSGPSAETAPFAPWAEMVPGPFESRMTAFMYATDETREAIEQMVPLHRSGRQDDVAGLVQFLSSRAGSYLTGTIIPLDGGITGCG